MVQPINQIMTSRPRHVKIVMVIIMIIMIMVRSHDPTSHFDGWDLKNDHFGTLFGPFLRGPKQVSSTPVRT